MQHRKIYERRENRVNFMLGNLKVEEFTKRLGIEITEEEKTELENMRCDSANEIPINKYHCFDIPLLMLVGSIEVAENINNILSKYSKEMKGRLQISVKKGAIQE